MSVANSGASLDAATEVGAGSAITYTAVCTFHSQQFTVSGYAGHGGLQVQLQLSLDGENWFAGDTRSVSADGTYQQTAAGVPALYARGYLAEIDTGVTAVSVSSAIAAS